MRIASFFALRLTSWISAIEARHSPSAAAGLTVMAQCWPAAQQHCRLCFPALARPGLGSTHAVAADANLHSSCEQGPGANVTLGLLAALQARAEGQPWTLYIMGMPRECRCHAAA